MPGIITHNIIFQESLKYLKKKKSRNYLSRSLETLFHDDLFRRAALFGTIGPNVFDYQPLRRNSRFGSRISMLIHDGGSSRMLGAMLDKLIQMTDHNTEWASTQRAYFYGFLSHMIGDAIFHPYIFYWTGFPDSNRRRDLFASREQNLLLEYNIDMFFSHYYYSDKYTFNLEEMFPLGKRGFLRRINPAVKDLLFDSLRLAFPGKERRYLLLKGGSEDTCFSKSFGYIDLSIYFMRWTYRLKRTRNERLIKFLKFLKNRKILYSDFIVRYPDHRKINKHVLNLHRERWFNPAGVSGLHYESVEDLLKSCCERITDIWELVEGIFVGSKRNYEKAVKEFSINALTGSPEAASKDLKIKNPVILRF